MSALRLVGIEKRFGARRVLRGADLTIPEGCRALLRGANGSGKSTLLQIAVGVLTADAGSVHIFDLSLDDRRRALRQAGYAPATADFPPQLTVTETMAFVSALKSCSGEAALAALDAWDLGNVASSTPEMLSLGERRRLVLAAATLGAPRLLLLDEPTVGLDARGRELLRERLAQHMAAGGSVLLTSHEGDAEATHTFELRDGRVMEG
ncbi:MAG: ATP-binding cassette domain-containing protein [Polyangiaceae bacterium]|nr:ATP-binding cassette domain-containing protein [Polyangiaceae bacterium]